MVSGDALRLTNWQIIYWLPVGFSFNLLFWSESPVSEGETLECENPQICWCGGHKAIYIFWNGYDVENVTYGTILWCKKLKFNLYPNAKRKFKVCQKKMQFQFTIPWIWCWMVLLTQSHIARHEAAIHAAARCRFAFTQLTVHVRCLSCYVLSPPSCPIVQRSKEHSRQNSPKWEVKSPCTFSFGPGSQSLTISVQFWRLSFWL